MVARKNSSFRTEDSCSASKYSASLLSKNKRFVLGFDSHLLLSPVRHHLKMQSFRIKQFSPSTFLCFPFTETGSTLSRAALNTPSPPCYWERGEITGVGREGQSLVRRHLNVKNKSKLKTPEVPRGRNLNAKAPAPREPAFPSRVPFLPGTPSTQPLF